MVVVPALARTATFLNPENMLGVFYMGVAKNCILASVVSWDQFDDQVRGINYIIGVPISPGSRYRFRKGIRHFDHVGGGFDLALGQV